MQVLVSISKLLETISLARQPPKRLSTQGHAIPCSLPQQLLADQRKFSLKALFCLLLPIHRSASKKLIQGLLRMTLSDSKVKVCPKLISRCHSVCNSGTDRPRTNSKSSPSGILHLKSQIRSLNMKNRHITLLRRKTLIAITEC